MKTDGWMEGGTQGSACVAAAQAQQGPVCLGCRWPADGPPQQIPPLGKAGVV